MSIAGVGALQGDFVIEFFVDRLVYGAHPALAHRTHDRESICDAVSRREHASAPGNVLTVHRTLQSRKADDARLSEGPRIFVGGEQIVDVGAQLRIVLACGPQEGVTLLRIAGHGGVEYLGNPVPALGRHRGRSPLRAAYSHARATCQSRSTVASEIPRTWPASIRERPPKNRNSAIWLFRGSNSANLIKARSRSRIWTSGDPRSCTSSSSVTLIHCPERFAILPPRAWSMRMRRIVCDATAKNCARFCQSVRSCLTRRR